MRAIVTPNGTLTLSNETFQAALGRGGVSTNKREGDGATPAGVLPLRNVLYRPDRGTAPVCAVPVRAMARDDGWCDAPSSPDYNRAVRLPFAASAEVLWRDDTVYDIIAILGWNDQPVVPGLGSAIFLHIACPDFAPTDGCVALSPDHLRRVLAMGLTELVVRTA